MDGKGRGQHIDRPDPQADRKDQSDMEVGEADERDQSGGDVHRWIPEAIHGGSGEGVSEKEA